MEVDEEEEEVDKHKQQEDEIINAHDIGGTNRRTVPIVSIMTPTKSMAQANSSQFDVANSPELVGFILFFCYLVYILLLTRTLT